MDEKTKEILDQLYAGTIDVHGAAEALNISVERIFGLVDQYTYVPTSDEVIEICKIELETIEYIKHAALRKLETRGSEQHLKPQFINLIRHYPKPFVDPSTSMRMLTTLLRKYKIRKKMNVPQAPREAFFVKFEKKHSTEYMQFDSSKARYPLLKTSGYVRHHEIKQFSTTGELKMIKEA
jgi:hypothetical protein